MLKQKVRKMHRAVATLSLPRVSPLQARALRFNFKSSQQDALIHDNRQFQVYSKLSRESNAINFNVI